MVHPEFSEAVGTASHDILVGTLRMCELDE